MKNILFLFIISMALGIVACSGQVNEGAEVENENFDAMLKTMLKGTVPTMNVDELKKNLGKSTILDSRERVEFEVSHLPGAKYIGYDVLEEEALRNVDKNKPVVVYCSIGVRSEKMGERLKEMGFQEVYNLYGSIFEWVNQGYSIVDMEEQETKQIHGYNRFWGLWMKNKNYKKVY